MLILMLLLDVSRRLSALPNPTAGCQSVTWIAQQFDLLLEPAVTSDPLTDGQPAGCAGLLGRTSQVCEHRLVSEGVSKYEHEKDHCLRDILF